MYSLSAHSLGVSQPVSGFVVTVTSYLNDINDELRDRHTNDPSLLEAVTTEYPADFNDAIRSVKRLQLANEGAMRSNIEGYLNHLLADAAAWGAGCGASELGIYFSSPSTRRRAPVTRNRRSSV